MKHLHIKGKATKNCNVINYWDKVVFWSVWSILETILGIVAKL